MPYKQRYNRTVRSTIPIRIVDILCLFFFLLLPLLKGLFFKELFYPMQIVLVLLLLGLIVLHKRLWINRHVLFLLSLQLIISGVSLFTGVNREESFFGFFEHLMPFLAFILFVSWMQGDVKLEGGDTRKIAGQENTFSSTVVQSGRKAGRLLWVVFGSGVIISLINYLHKSSVDVVGQRLDFVRFGTVIPYANTLALYLFCNSLIGLHFASQQKVSPWIRFFVRVGIILCISAIILTYSRAMWVLSFLFYGVYFWMAKSRRITWEILIALIFAVPVAAFTALTHFRLTGVILLALVLINILRTILSIYFVKKNDISIPLKTVAVTIFTMLVSTVILLLPKSGALFARISSIGLRAQELQERFAYYRDAITIIKGYFLLGAGPGGWDSLQYSYQTALYATKYVHSSLVQSAVDYGILGMIIFLLQIGIFAYHSVRAHKRSKDKDSAGFVTCIIIMNTAILLHSLIDIDFQFPLIRVLFWVNIGILCCFTEELSAIDLRVRSRMFIAAIALFTVMALAIPVSVSSGYYSKGEEQFKNGDLLGAEADFQNAVTYFSWSSNASYMLGQVQKELYQSTQLLTWKNASLENFLRAEKYNPQSPLYPAAKAHLFKLAGEYEKSVECYRELVDMQPLVIDHYENLARMLMLVAEAAHEAGDTSKATQGFEEVIGIMDRLEKADKKVVPAAYKLKNKPSLSLTPEIEFDVGKSYYYLGDRNKGEAFLRLAAQVNDFVGAVEEFKAAFK